MKEIDMQRQLPAIGELVHAQLPGHGVLWSKEHGWHRHEKPHAHGTLIVMHPATPGTGKARVLAHNEDGTLDLELPGHYTNERAHRQGPGMLYDTNGYVPPEIIRNV